MITHRVLFSEIQRTTVRPTYHSMTLKILFTHAFDAGTAIIYCRSFNKIGAVSWLNFKGIPYPSRVGKNLRFLKKDLGF